MIWKYDAEWPAACFKAIDTHASVASCCILMAALAIQVPKTPTHKIRPFNSPQPMDLEDVGNLGNLERSNYGLADSLRNSRVMAIVPSFVYCEGAYPATTPGTSGHRTKETLILQLLQSKSLSFKSCKRKVAPSNVAHWLSGYCERENPQAGPNVFVPRKIRFDQFKRYVLILRQSFIFWRKYFWHTFVGTYDTALLV